MSEDPTARRRAQAGGNPSATARREFEQSRDDEQLSALIDMLNELSARPRRGDAEDFDAEAIRWMRFHGEERVLAWIREAFPN